MIVGEGRGEGRGGKGGGRDGRGGGEGGRGGGGRALSLLLRHASTSWFCYGSHVCSAVTSSCCTITKIPRNVSQQKTAPVCMAVSLLLVMHFLV